MPQQRRIAQSPQSGPERRISKGRLRQFLRGIGRRIKLTFIHALRRSFTEHKIALSVALGIFTGLAVPMGLQTVFALVLVFVLRAHAPLMLLFTLVTNPFTVLPLYGFIFWLGQLISGISISRESIDQVLHFSSFEAFFNLGSQGVLVFFAGSLPLAALSAPVVYFVVRWLVHLYHEKRRKQRDWRKKMRSLLTKHHDHAYTNKHEGGEQ